jgi:hypothetical protein
MNSDFDDELRRRFADAHPVASEDGFVLRVGDALRRRRRQRQLLTGLGVVAIGMLATLGAPLLSPLIDLVQRGTAALVALAGEAPNSPVAAVLLGALVFAGAAVTWTLRRL